MSSKTTYKALRPVCLNHTHLDIGDTIDLHPRTAQFLLADGTLMAVKTKKSATKAATKIAVKGA